MANRTRPFELSVDHPEGPLPLICDLDPARGASRGTVIVVHGFKGYKDYGMFPYLAHRLAESGRDVLRVNLAHSGMTRDHATFARPDLFSRDTWKRQVHDLLTLVGAVADGDVPVVDRTLPLTLLGHSRGGVSSILAGGRTELVAGVITISAPAATVGTSGLEPAQRKRLHADGYLEVESARTGQLLRVGAAFHDEVDADPVGHDVVAHARALRDRLVVIHGSADATVPPDDAGLLSDAAGIEPIIVPGADHVFNAPNPFPVDDPPSAELAILLELLLGAMDGYGR